MTTYTHVPVMISPPRLRHRIPLIRVEPSDDSSPPPPPPSLASWSTPQRPMSPTPIAPNAVALTLQYIAPPSRMDQPLPPYLLSKSLLQRHHYLGISPDDPAEYLCWPSDSTPKAIDLLERHAAQLDSGEPPKFPVQYTTDGEDTYAHVALPEDDSLHDGARLVFQWDVTDGWKFHDTKLMPFPPASSPSLREVLSSSAESSAHAAAESESLPAYNLYGFEHDDSSGSDGNDEDDYWNAYGATDSGSPSPFRQSQTVKEWGGDSEDAYWARYSSVHGTADSTIPSPREPRRRPAHTFALTDDNEQPHGLYQSEHQLPGLAGETEVLRIPHNDVFTRVYGLGMGHAPNNFAPASPTILARLLEDISPRATPPDFDDEGLELASDKLGVSAFDVEPCSELSPLDGSDDSDETPSSEDNHLEEAPGLAAIATVKATPRSEVAAVKGAVSASTSYTDIDRAEQAVDEEEEALRQSIQGLYTLWRLNRTRKGLSTNKEVFMSTIGDAIKL